jgi:hypothetical protein
MQVTNPIGPNIRLEGPGSQTVRVGCSQEENSYNGSETTVAFGIGDTGVAGLAITLDLEECMRKTQKPLLMLLALACVATPTFGQRCGKERWSVKTGTDAGASQVDLSNPQTAKIADLVTLQPPSPLPTDTRFAPTEKTVFVVDATLTDFKLESGSTGDSDYHLVLDDDQGNTMVAEIPSPSCVDANSPFAARIAAARAAFDAQLTATSSFQTANVPVRVTGVGFFDFFHNQHGAAPNVIELHPVLDIQFNPTPSDGDFTVSLSSATMHLHGGGSSAVTATAASVRGGSPASVSFTTSGLPAGVTSRSTPGANGQAKLVLSAKPGAAHGAFPIIVTGSASGRSHSQAIALTVSDAPSASEEQQWEYKLIGAASEQDVVDQANHLGEQGWEMVGVVRVPGPPVWRAFFKRATKD